MDTDLIVYDEFAAGNVDPGYDSDSARLERMKTNLVKSTRPWRSERQKFVDSGCEIWTLDVCATTLYGSGAGVDDHKKYGLYLCTRWQDRLAYTRSNTAITRGPQTQMTAGSARLAGWSGTAH